MGIQALISSTALFKLKPDADVEKIKQWQKLAEEMVGQVPGRVIPSSPWITFLFLFLFLVMRLSFLTSSSPPFPLPFPRSAPPRPALLPLFPKPLLNKAPYPGLISLQTGPPIELTAAMAKGFDMGAVVLLDYVESLATFFTHPSHIEYVFFFYVSPPSPFPASFPSSVSPSRCFKIYPYTPTLPPF